ncbi:MAG: hypothetical protein KatS3mg105_0156 [Gemmatales bacterium]|nr:MAG: hypothetical protein KatS3mg105_0156 [Gemmatales bacterium]
MGHEALRQPEIFERVVATWGQQVVKPDGDIDRRQLGRIVFNDPAERKKLEALVFPYIGEGIKRQIAQAQEDERCRFVVLDAAIMLETGWNNVCDWIVYVDSPRPIRLQRLAESRGWDEKEVIQRERAQMPLTKKASRADFAIDNSGTPEDVARQVDRFIQQLEKQLRIGSMEKSLSSSGPNSSVRNCS